MVTVTSFETTPPLPSSTVTVNVSVVGPVAGVIDRERAIRTLAAVVDGPGVRVGRVNVGDVDLAGSDQGAIFRDCAVSLAGQDGDIVGAHDRDHDLTGRAISRRNGEGLGQGLARAQALNGRVVVGQVVRPLAIGIDGERAMLASGIRLGDKHGFARVGVGDIQLAAAGLMTAPSSVPLMVTVTSFDTTPPLPSSTVTVNVSVNDSPDFRPWTSLLALSRL
ncbi:hypothetical protein G6F62_013211 [Rhizopus arrhizus]|nr:hypothetical protein G6F62_013211 [Rhizopus arrhizus]